MENTRLRELTQRNYSLVPAFAGIVEMENTRLRELTHLRLEFLWQFHYGRNGEYPFKGIDTREYINILFSPYHRRNGEYPYKGIDTLN